MKWLKSLTACRWGVALLLLLAVMFLAVSTSSAAGIWEQKFMRFSGTAGETLTTGDVVCILPSTGKIYKADADNATARPAVGVIGKGGAADSTVEIIPAGILGKQTNSANGTRLFLSNTPGAFTATGPGGNQTLAVSLGEETRGGTLYSKFLVWIGLPTPADAGY